MTAAIWLPWLLLGLGRLERSRRVAAPTPASSRVVVYVMAAG